MIFTKPSSARFPVATDEDRSGSKSTSEKLTEDVVKAVAPVAVLTLISAVDLSLIE